MSRPEVDEVLFAYIVVASHAVSLVLIRDDSGVQKSVYYTCKSLHEAKVHYLLLEKAILAVVQASTLLLVTHGYCPNPTPTQISTSKC